KGHPPSVLTKMVGHQGLILKGVFSAHGKDGLGSAHGIVLLLAGDRLPPSHLLFEDVKQGYSIAQAADKHSVSMAAPAKVFWCGGRHTSVETRCRRKRIP